MSIFERIRQITQASINELLEQAESPDELLTQKIRELEDTIREAKQAVADFAVSLKRMERDAEQLGRERDERQAKAETSLKAGDEDAARKALGDKLRAEERIHGLRPSVERNRTAYDELKRDLATLRDQLRTARLRLSGLKSREQAAAAEKAFGDTLDKAAASAGNAELARMEDDVVRAEARTTSEREVRGALERTEADAERRAAELEVEAELDALKQKMKA